MYEVAKKEIYYEVPCAASTRFISIVIWLKSWMKTWICQTKFDFINTEKQRSETVNDNRPQVKLESCLVKAANGLKN